jgi:hypothetical protein
MDAPWGVIGDANRLVAEYGVYAGDAFSNWMRKQAYAFSGNANLTFRQMKEMARPTFRELYLVGTICPSSFRLFYPMIIHLIVDCGLRPGSR